MKTNSLTAVLEGGATKYVKGVGICVSVKLTAKADDTLMQLLRRSTGGVVVFELEEAQEDMGLFPDAAPDEPNPFQLGKRAE